jgi:hypothetical protein
MTRQLLSEDVECELIRKLEEAGLDVEMAGILIATPQVILSHWFCFARKQWRHFLDETPTAGLTAGRGS